MRRHNKIKKNKNQFSEKPSAEIGFGFWVFFWNMLSYLVFSMTDHEQAQR